MEVDCGAAEVGDVSVAFAALATATAGRTGVDATEMLGVGGAGGAGVGSAGLRTAASVSLTDLAGADIDADGALDVGADDGPAFASWRCLCAGAASGPAAGVEGAAVVGGEVVGVEGVDVEMGDDPCAEGESDAPVVGCGEPASLESAVPPGTEPAPVGDEPPAVVVELGDP